MSAEQTNRLARSASPYLRSAAHQPVEWYEWGEEAFARARAEDKPILLAIGAVWCHWCHVIDRESYEDPVLAALINKLFVPVKVDRDERPDVDARYQTAISAVSGQGGWPLTGFLLSDGRPFYGGTYFPPQDSMGRPSFRRVLENIAEAFRSRRDEVEKAAGALVDAVQRTELFEGARGSWTPAIINELTGSILEHFDPRPRNMAGHLPFPTRRTKGCNERPPRWFTKERSSYDLSSGSLLAGSVQTWCKVFLIPLRLEVLAPCIPPWPDTMARCAKTKIALRRNALGRSKVESPR